MEKKKPVDARFCRHLTFRISVYCRSNVMSHAEWSIFLSHLSENKCSEKVSYNFREGKTFQRQKFFVGNNFRRNYLFVSKCFCPLMKHLSLFTSRVFTDKVIH